MSDDREDSFNIDMDKLDELLEEERKRMNHSMKLKIEQFTDPLCGWCYGMEPATTKLRFQLGDKLDYSYTMGLMIPDARQLTMGPDGLTRFGEMKRQLAVGFSMMEKVTGMPMSVDHIEELQPEDVVSLQSSLAYEAIKIMSGPARAMAFLHYVRQAVFAFGMPIGRRCNVDALVESFGVDLAAYREVMETGEPQLALNREVDRCRSLGVDSYPTLRITYGSVKAMIGRYESPADLAQTISRITEGNVELDQPEYSERRALDLLDQFGRVAGEELRVAFNLTGEGLNRVVGELLDHNLVEITSCGEGMFIERKDK